MSRLLLVPAAVAGLFLASSALKAQDPKAAVPLVPPPATCAPDCVEWGVSIRDNGRNAFSGCDKPANCVTRIMQRLRLGRRNEACGLPKHRDQLH